MKSNYKLINQYIFAEKGDKNQECGVHAISSITLSYTQCCHVVFLWPSHQRLQRCSKFFVSAGNICKL